MNRRDFLLKSLSASVALTLVGCGKTQTSGEHASMPGMADKNAGAQATQALAAMAVLPQGLPLQGLPLLANQSMAENTFKATLTAAPMQYEIIAGKPTEVWAYNDSRTPLLIELVEGMTVEIELVNQLSQPTTLHWHGLPVPPEQDGGPMEAVPPNGKRTYTFTLPDDCAGTYWFHPHPHHVTHEQVFRGLAGALIVRPRTPDALAQLPETHVFVTDLKLNADGSIAQNDVNDDMNGREGQFLLVNGQYQPTLDLNEATRLRVWNCTNARFLNLQLQNNAASTVALTQIGTDGGLLTTAQTHSELLLAPAERAELLLNPTSSQATTLKLNAAAYNQGKMGMVQATPASTLVDLTLAGTAFKLPRALRTIAPLGDALHQQRVVMSETMSMANGVHDMKFFINDQQFDMNRVDFNSVLGVVEEWTVDNTSDMDHPFHIHGGQFQPIGRAWLDATKGEPTQYAPSWKDVINVRSGESVRFKMRQIHKGVRMLHCHILEHEDAGMMANVHVV